MGFDWDRWGKRLRSLRRDREWSQSELAEKVGVSRNTINRLEIRNRKPSVELLERLAGVLGLSLPELLSHGEKREPSRRRCSGRT
jgi:putative transcriptional regulator